MKKLLTALFALTPVLSGCANNNSRDNSKAETTAAEISVQTIEETPQTKEVKTPDPYKYVHGDGYFNPKDEGVGFTTDRQRGGTCWIYSAVCSMEALYSMKYGKPIEISHTHVLDKAYLKRSADIRLTIGVKFKPNNTCIKAVYK